jgi:uncharacterized protein YkwD
MARRWRTGLAAAALVIVTACSSAPSAPDNAGPRIEPAGSLSATAADLIELTNAERRRAGLPELRANDRLVRAAQIQAEQVAAAGRLEHTLAGAGYPALEDRLAAAGYEWRDAGENLASGQRGAAEAMVTWMNSPGHRANILNDAYTELGTGFLIDRNGRPYYVQVFGRPR